MTFVFQRPARALVLLVAALMLAGCASTYYKTLETFGIEKRDILSERVEDARDAQVDAKEQFVNALEQYRSVVNFDGGDLERTYNKLNREFERSEGRAAAVTERIDSIETVAEDLFDEWQEEIDLYTDAGLKRQSRTLLSETQGDYREMIASMRRAERSMNPVLALFRDQVLFLRHNLNARAIGGLESELANIESATNSLIVEMERSITDASEFIDSMS